MGASNDKRRKNNVQPVQSKVKTNTADTRGRSQQTPRGGNTQTSTPAKQTSTPVKQTTAPAGQKTSLQSTSAKNPDKSNASAPGHTLTPASDKQRIMLGHKASDNLTDAAVKAARDTMYGARNSLLDKYFGEETDSRNRSRYQAMLDANLDRMAGTVTNSAADLAHISDPDMLNALRRNSAQYDYTKSRRDAVMQEYQKQLDAFNAMEQAGYGGPDLDVRREELIGYMKDAKNQYNESLGNIHASSEYIRAVEGGYSGGAAGNEYNPAKLPEGWEENLSNGVAGNLAASWNSNPVLSRLHQFNPENEQYNDYLLGAQRLQAEADWQRKYGTEGAAEWAERWRDAYYDENRNRSLGERAALGIEAAGKGLYGGLDAAAALASQYILDPMQRYWQDKDFRGQVDDYSQSIQLRNRALRGEDITDEQMAIADQAARRYDTVMQYAETGLNLSDTTKEILAQADVAQRKAVSGMGYGSSAVASGLISAVQNLPSIAVGILTENPALATAMMGAMAAGQEAYQLSTGIAPQNLRELAPTAFYRGGVEIVTEYVSMDYLVNMAKSPAGREFFSRLFAGILSDTPQAAKFAIRTGGNMAVMSGIEGAEEVTADFLNYAYDVARQDPGAQISIDQIVQSFIGGAVAGLGFGGAGTVASLRNAAANGIYDGPTDEEVRGAYDYINARRQAYEDSIDPYEEMVDNESGLNDEVDAAIAERTRAMQDVAVNRWMQNNPADETVEETEPAPVPENVRDLAEMYQAGEMTQRDLGQIIFDQDMMEEIEQAIGEKSPPDIIGKQKWLEEKLGSVETGVQETPVAEQETAEPEQEQAPVEEQETVPVEEPVPAEQTEQTTPAEQQETVPVLETAEPRARDTSAPVLETNPGLTEQEIEQSMESIRAAADELGVEQDTVQNQQTPAKNNQTPVQNDQTPVQTPARSAYDVRPVQTAEQAQNQMAKINTLATSDHFGAAGVKAFKEGYNITQWADDYYQDFARVYNAALRGNLNVPVRTMTREQVNGAVEAARQDRAAKDESYGTPTRSRNAGAVFGEWENAHIGSTVRNSIDKLAKKLGVNVQFVDSIEGRNASYDGSTVTISRAALEGNNPIAFLVGHEFTHRLQDTAPKEYKELRRMVQNMPAFNRRLAMWQEKNPDMEMAELIDEAVADTVGKLLHETDTLVEFANNASPSLLQRLADFFKSIRDVFSKQEVSDVDRVIDVLTRAAKVTKQSEKNLAWESEESPGHWRANVVSYEEGGREQLEQYLKDYLAKNGIAEDSVEGKDIMSTLDELDAIYRIVDDVIVSGKYVTFNVWNDARVVKGKDGKPIYSVVKPNDEYSMNIDMSLVCKKRRALDRVFNRMIKNGMIDNFSLSPQEIAKINQILREEGLETSCDLCFVDAKRFRMMDTARTFANIWNRQVNSMVGARARMQGFVPDYFNFGGNPNAPSQRGITSYENPSFRYLNKVMKNNGPLTVEHKIAKLLKEHPEYRRLCLASDFMSADSFDVLRRQAPEVMKIFNSKKGNTGPKSTETDTPYLNEIIQRDLFNRDKAYAIGGVRIQSFSDYIARFFFDYAQIVADLAAKRLPAHAYTKEDAFALQFGMTGIKINMSLVPDVIEGGKAPGLDEKGNYAWKDGHSFGSSSAEKGSAEKGFELACQIQSDPKYGRNCGTIAVGVSNEHIAMMLKDPNIRMVIPYHKSGLNPAVAEMTRINQYWNYEPLQHTRDANGKDLPSSQEFPFDEALQRHKGDARAAAKEYLEWCEKNGYTPKFKGTLPVNGEKIETDFTTYDGYYKVLIDFNSYDSEGNPSPQGDVKMVFPQEGDTFGSIKDLMTKYLEIDEQNQRKIDGINDAFIYEKIGKALEWSQQGHKDIARYGKGKDHLKGRASSVDYADILGSSTEEMDSRYMAAVESGDMETAQEMVNARADQLKAEVFAMTDTPAYRVRRKAPPKVTKKVYKVFTMSPDGKPTALFVSSNQKLPVGVWLDAKDTFHFVDQKNGLAYVPSTKNPYSDGGATGSQVKLANISAEDIAELEKRGYIKKGKNGKYPKSITALAYRPGWHAGDLPFFPQGGMRGNQMVTENGVTNAFYDPAKPGSNYTNIHRYNQVVYECEIAYDVDYTSHNEKGALQDMQEMPRDGGYAYSTNPMTQAEDLGKWYISSSLKIVRALSQEECDRILQENGRLPQEWEERDSNGDLVTTDDVRAITDEEREQLKLGKVAKDAKKRKALDKEGVPYYRASDKSWRYNPNMEPPTTWIAGRLDLDALGYDPKQTDGGKKLLDPVTYDDNGNPIPLSQRFNADVKDVRYSSVGYDDLLEQYGSIEQGENPVRDVRVPKRTNKYNKVDKTIRSFMEAGVTPDEMVPTIQQMLENGSFSYTPYTDKAAISGAEQTINANGGAINYYHIWQSNIRKGNVDKSLTAQGIALYNAFATQGDAQRALEVVTDMIVHERKAAQAVQAMRILKQMSPSAQLYGVQKQVLKLRDDVQRKYGFAAGNTKKKGYVDDAMDELEQRRDALLDEIGKLDGKAKRLRRWIQNAKKNLSVDPNRDLTAEHLIREIGDIFSAENRRDYARKHPKDAAAAQLAWKSADWVDYIAGQLENSMYGKAKPKPDTPQLIAATILKDLNAFADQYVVRAKSERKPRTAVDRMRDYFANRAEYARAWNQAIQKFKEDHADDTEAMDAMEAWMNGTISYAGQGTDKVMLSAVAQAALEGDVQLKNLMQRAALGDLSAVQDEIYTRLYSAIGNAAKGNEKQLRGAVERWVKEQADSKPVNLDAIIRKAATADGKSVADLVRAAKMGDAEVIADRITDRLEETLGIQNGNNDILRDTVRAWIGTQVAGRETDIPAILQKGIERSLREAGLSVREMIGKNSGTKEMIGEQIAQELSGSFGLSADSAAYISGLVLEMYNDTLAMSAQEYLENRFKDKGDRETIRTSIADKLIRLGNMGAFSDEDFKVKATNEILGGEYDVAMNPELVDQFIAAGTETDRNEILKEIYRDIGRQLPATIMDKLNALRYLAMLFNVVTHGRNITGNAAFFPAVMAKNLLATAIETHYADKLENRTKGIPTVELIKAGIQDFPNVREMILQGGKYDETKDLNEYIQAGRTIFGFKPVEFLRKVNGDLLNGEDVFFAKPQYAIALAQYCAANGITAEMIRTGEGIEKEKLDAAKGYAIQEAAKATYRDLNDFSDFISGLGRKAENTKWDKVSNLLMNGMLPFRRTPANVAARAFEYSPFGFLKGMKHLLWDVRHKGTMDPVEVIDELSAGLTGIGLVALGGLLGALGLLHAAGDDDDKRLRFEKDTGHQPWAFEIAGTSVTVDWMTPGCIPMLMGANIGEKMRKEGFSFKSFLNALDRVYEPMIDMSVLKSVDDTFDSIRGWDTGSASSIVTIVSNLAVGWLTQMNPTLFGQVERASEDTRMMSWSGKGSTLTVGGHDFELPDVLPDNWKYAIAKQTAKIPGIDFNQTEYVDVWGNTQDNGHGIRKALNIFVNPAKVRTIDESQVNDFITGLADKNKSVIPAKAERSITVDGNEIELTKNQYNTYAKSLGQNRYDLVRAAVGSTAFNRMTDEQKIKAIGSMYEYANYLAKMATIPEIAESKTERTEMLSALNEQSDAWLRNVGEAKKNGCTVIDYFVAKAMTSGIESYKDTVTGKTIEHSVSLQKATVINGIVKKDGQRAWLYDMCNVDDTVSGWNPAYIESELANAQRQGGLTPKKKG